MNGDSSNTLNGNVSNIPLHHNGCHRNHGREKSGAALLPVSSPSSTVLCGIRLFKLRPLSLITVSVVLTITMVSLLAQSRYLSLQDLTLLEHHSSSVLWDVLSSATQRQTIDEEEEEEEFLIEGSSTLRASQSASSSETSSFCESSSSDPKQGPLLLVWAYDEAPPAEAVQSALEQLLLTHNADTSASTPIPSDIRVFCGSNRCLDMMQALAGSMDSTACWTISRLVVHDLAAATPLEDWMDQHVLAKLLAAHDYEHHLQAAMQLAALWKYGGQVGHMLHPTLILEEQQRFTSGTVQVLQYNHSILSSWGGLWGAHSASAEDDSLIPFCDYFLKQYNWDRQPHISDQYQSSNWPVKVNWDVFCDTSKSCSTLSISPSNLTEYPPPASHEKVFATLSYDARRTYLLSTGNPGMNLGDEMQGLAGIQFIPRLDAFVERDRLDLVRFTKDGNVTGNLTFQTPGTEVGENQRVHAFLNAWWGTPNMTWPPPSFIEPVTISMHYQPKVYKMIQKNESQRFFKDNAPIGARDLKTLSILNTNVSVPALFTACMTMSLTLSPYTGKKEGILLVDVKNKEFLEQVVPGHVIDQAQRVTHKVLGHVAGNNMLRYLGAFEKLMLYRKAKLVITERLHTALPSIAMGTPVVFLDGGTLIGGGGSRLEGLERFMHYVRSGQKVPDEFDWFNPPDNPEKETFKRYSTTIKHLAACHSGITDSARKFGMVPESLNVDVEPEVCTETVSSAPHPNAIHIATVLDGNYLHTVFPSWVNALALTNGDVDLVLYVLTDQLSSKQHCLLRLITEHLLPETATVYTLPVEFSEEVIKNYRGLRHVPVATQARLYLGSLLPCVDKVLWMDLDALAVGSLKKLWHSITIPSCGISARESVTENFFDGNNQTKSIKWNKKYGKSFNAGVMLIRLDNLRKRRFEETIVKYWGEQRGLNDQFVYNLACNGTYGRLPQTMNVFQSYPKHTPPRDDWIIAHFQSSMKPWAGAEVEPSFQGVWNASKISFEEAIAVVQGPRSSIRDPHSVLLLPGAQIQQKRPKKEKRQRAGRRVKYANREQALAALRKRAKQLQEKQIFNKRHNSPARNAIMKAMHNPNIRTRFISQSIPSTNKEDKED